MEDKRRTRALRVQLRYLERIEMKRKGESRALIQIVARSKRRSTSVPELMFPSPIPGTRSERYIRGKQTRFDMYSITGCRPLGSRNLSYQRLLMIFSEEETGAEVKRLVGKF